jgi:hypothetical protein
MLKFLKTMVAEDVITTEEALVADSVVVEVQHQEEKEVLLQEEKDLVADLEATEDLLQEKVVLDQEVLLLQEQVVFHQTEDQEQKVHLTELQDVLKALVMHQDQEDQEETKKRF